MGLVSVVLGSTAIRGRQVHAPSCRTSRRLWLCNGWRSLDVALCRGLDSSWLRRERQARGWRQLDLARRLGIASYPPVSAWEKGKVLPGWSSVQGIARVFNLPAREVARGLGWIPAPGDPCPCGCGGEIVPPLNPNGIPFHCRVRLPCRGCGAIRTYQRGVEHLPLCIGCSNRARTGTLKAPRLVFERRGFLDFGKVRHAERCTGSRAFTQGEVRRYEKEGCTIDERSRTFRCFACARAANVLTASDAFLENAYENSRRRSRPRGVRKERIRSLGGRRELRSSLYRGDILPLLPTCPPSRAGATHSLKSRELISPQSLLRAWRKPGGAIAVEFRLCRLCGRVLMVETDRLKAGKLGLFHRRCSDEWRRRVGKADPTILGRAPRIPLPGQRSLGRKGRFPAPLELKEHFRWMILKRLGNMSYGSIAMLVSKEQAGVVSRSTIQDGIAWIECLLPPLDLASVKFRPYLLALQTARVLLPAS